MLTSFYHCQQAVFKSKKAKAKAAERDAACLRRSVYNAKPTAETEPMDGRLRQRSTQDRAGGTGQGA